jgi:tetratricopeptide (TPR) repeat protein
MQRWGQVNRSECKNGKLNVAVETFIVAADRLGRINDVLAAEKFLKYSEPSTASIMRYLVFQNKYLLSNENGYAIWEEWPDEEIVKEFPFSFYFIAHSLIVCGRISGAAIKKITLPIGDYAGIEYWLNQRAECPGSYLGRLYDTTRNMRVCSNAAEKCFNEEMSRTTECIRNMAVEMKESANSVLNYGNYYYRLAVLADKNEQYELSLKLIRKARHIFPHYNPFVELEAVYRAKLAIATQDVEKSGLRDIVNLGLRYGFGDKACDALGVAANLACDKNNYSAALDKICHIKDFKMNKEWEDIKQKYIKNGCVK